MDKNLKNINLLPFKELSQIAGKHLTIFKKRVRDKGQDYQGQRFAPYSKEYAELKANGMKDETGVILKQYQGVSIVSRNVTKPDFTLTGRTLRNLSVRKVYSDYYILGWDGEAGGIVESNAYRRRGAKRNIIDDLPNEEKEIITKMIGDAIENQLKKLNDVKIYVG